MARKPRGQVRGPGPSPALAALPAPPARGAALPGVGGRFQFRLRDPGCTLGPEGQPEEGRRGHRPGRTCRPEAPRLQLLVPSPRTGAPTALHPTLPELTALKYGLSPTALSPRAMGFAEVSVWLGPWVRDPRTHKVVSFTVRNAHTDTCGYTRPAVALSTVSPFQSPQPHGPSCGHFSPVGVDRGGRRTAARPGEAWIRRAAREVPSFPSLVPGAPRKRAAQPPPPRSHRRRAAPGFNQFRIEPGQRRSQGERWREQGDRRRERE